MDNVILNKVAIIENCLRRLHEEYDGCEEELEGNYTKQDSIVLNLQRACEAAIDLGARIVRIKKLGLPQTSRDVFVLLETAQIIPAEISHRMQAMVGFRNVAIHEYQKVNLGVIRSILSHHLGDFKSFITVILPHSK